MERTKNGLDKLATIVKQARGTLSPRQFGTLCNLHHMTIRKIEASKNGELELSTFEKLSPHTPYTVEELIAISRSQPIDTVKQYRVAEDIAMLATDLPDVELARLVELLAQKLTLRILSRETNKIEIYKSLTTSQRETTNPISNNVG
ncbi:MAG: hypothetical protein ACRC11_10800 [Xenococcaceae cyanobacterium]